jgi:hypothetical protein
VPFTIAEQNAVLAIVHDLLPPLVFGVGPQWGRFHSIEYDVDPTSVSDANNSATADSYPSARTVNMSLLFSCLLPAIFEDASDTFPQVGKHAALTRTATDQTRRLVSCSCFRVHSASQVLTLTMMSVHSATASPDPNPDPDPDHQ